jgi:hypothetical protein
MSTKHTPGPWTYRYEKFEGGTTYGRFETKMENPRVNDPVIFAVREDWQTHLDRHPEGIANARLIASAPNLLEALQAMVNAYGNGPRSEATRLVALEAADAALAMVRGDT